jgi:hypothetical protein
MRLIVGGISAHLEEPLHGSSKLVTALSGASATTARADCQACHPRGGITPRAAARQFWRSVQ